MEFGNCENKVIDSRIVFEEKKSKVTFLNPNGFLQRKIKIDNCVITEGIRCDYLLITDKRLYYFVELKGSDVDHAVEQIAQTLARVDTKKAECILGVVVTYRNQLSGTQIQNHMKKMLRQKCRLRIISSNRELLIGE